MFLLRQLCWAKVKFGIRCVLSQDYQGTLTCCELGKSNSLQTSDQDASATLVALAAQLLLSLVKAQAV
jgi:hypothetical protein